MSVTKSLLGNWKRPDNYIVLVIVVFFLGWVIGPRVQIDSTNALRLLTMFLAPLLATFSGAWLAFKLRENRERRLELEKRKSAINRAIFTLTRQWQTMRGYWMQIREDENDGMRFINVPAISTGEVVNITLDLDSISFLLDTEHRDELMKLSVEQICYDQAIQSIALRSEAMVSEFHRVFEASGVNGKTMTTDQAKELLGERIYGRATSLTDNMYTTVGQSRIKLKEAIDRLYTVGKLLYPDDVIVRGVVDDPKEQQTANPSPSGDAARTPIRATPPSVLSPRQIG